MVKKITTTELRQGKINGGIIFQGCTEPHEDWVNGVNEMLTDEGILLEGTKYKPEDCYTFEHEGITNLVFPFEPMKLDIGKLAMWRLATHGTFSAKWVEDYVDNRLGGPLTKNGEPIEYKLGDDIVESGVYTAKFTDKLGNTSEVTFTIVDALVGKFESDIASIPGFEKVIVNDTELDMENAILSLTESGTYKVEVVANGVSNTFEITVDATAPTLTVNGVDEEGRAKKTVTLTDLSEEATVKVFLNDTEIEYADGDELTEEGNYKVVVTDDCGNSTEYNFEIKHGLNGGIIALIVILSLLAVGGVVVFILYKKTDVFGNKRYR